MLFAKENIVNKVGKDCMSIFVIVKPQDVAVAIWVLGTVEIMA